ncbi:MAG: tetratricopeptide repeat protein [Anaerolineae bacterium]|nr:tetratricopeptide repeat protein [Anaerolineae bacterium]
MASLKRQAQYQGLNERSLEILRLLAEGLSDREIAERLVMTVNTIKWYNRQIYSILGVGSRTQAIARARELQLLDQDNSSEAAVRVVSAASKRKLPLETTRFIGRQRETDDITRLLQSAHLLTLTGSPGTGKTRLALRVAADLRQQFLDGVYFIALAPVSDPALVPNAIAAALGVIEVVNQPLIVTLKHHLSRQQALLILDNFEHLLSASMLVSDLIAAAPDVKVLVTSREVLHLYGEQEYFVMPLALPHLEAGESLSALAEYESVAMFVQQARAVIPDFALTDENAHDVARICVRLDGLPLAIELAAARIKLLTPRTLLLRLNSRLDTLTGGAHDLPTRQQTLRNTIEWSYNLLDDGEKRLFARLAVFRGGGSLEAIELVCGIDLPIDVFDGLASLVDKSLVQQKASALGEPCFVMLQTLHEYAETCLQGSGEAALISRRHAEYFVGLAERAQPELRLAQQKYWSETLDGELDNLRAALEWSLRDGDVTLGIRIAAAVYLFWATYGYHVEGYRWNEQFLRRLDEVSITYQIAFLIGAGHMAFFYDLEIARDLFLQARELAQQSGEKRQLAWATIFLGYTMLREMAVASDTVEEGLALFRELHDQPGIAQALNILGEVARFGGDDQSAKRAYEECLIISQQTGETRRIRFIYSNLAFVAQHQGDHDRAIELGYKGLALAIEMNNRLELADSLAVLAGALSTSGQPRQAARLYGAWQGTMEKLEALTQPADKPEHDRNIASIRAQLDEATFSAAWEEGRALTLEQAASAALELRSGDPNR